MAKTDNGIHASEEMKNKLLGSESVTRNGLAFINNAGRGHSYVSSHVSGKGGSAPSVSGQKPKTQRRHSK